MDTEEEAIIINKNLQKIKSITNKIQNEQRKNALLNLIEKTNKQLTITPASTKEEYVSCYFGGLLEHMIRTCTFMAKARDSYNLEESFSLDSVIVTSLFHDIGKIGIDNEEYYIKLPISDWRVTKLKQKYEINPNLINYPVSQLSLQILTKNNVELTNDEWLAISSIRDKHVLYDDPSTPNKHESPLTILLQQAVKMSCLKGKNRTETYSLL